MRKGNDEAESRKLNSEWEMGNLERGSRTGNIIGEVFDFVDNSIHKPPRLGGMRI